MNTEKQPLVDAQLRRRRAASLNGQVVTVTNSQKTPGSVQDGGQVVITQDDGQSFKLPCDRLRGETFVLDSDGLSVELIGTLKSGPVSILLHVPDGELDDQTVQEAYDFVYDVDDECKAMGGSTSGVREVIRENRFTDDGSDASVGAVGTPAGYQGAGSDGIVVPQRGAYSQPMVASPDGNAYIDKLLDGGVPKGVQSYGSIGSYASDRRGAMDINEQQQYGAMQSPQSSSYDWSGTHGQALGDLGSPNADFNQMRDMMNELINKMSNNTSSNRKEIDELNAKYTQQLIKNEQINQQLIKAQDENNALHDTLNSYTTQIADKERSLAELQKTITASAEACETIQRELDATKAKLEQTEKDAQGHIDTANAAVDAMRAQLSSTQLQMKSLNDTIRAKDEQAQKDADAISTLQETIRSERSKSSKLSDDLVAAKDSVSAARDEVKAQYEQRLAAMSNDLSEARKNAKDTEALATRSMHELSEKTMKHIQEQQSQFNAERERLKKQVSDISSLLDTVTNDRDALRSQIAIVSRSMSTARAKLSASEANVKDLTSELDDAKQRYDAVSKRNERLTQQLESAQQSVDIARSNAENTSKYAAQKYAEAIKQRDTCENTLSAMRDAMREHDVDPAVIAIVDQALSDIMGTKGNDNPMLLAAAAAGGADDVYNVNGRYMSGDEIDAAAGEVASQYVGDGDADDTDAADDAEGEFDGDDRIDVDASADADDMDDDYSFPVNGDEEGDGDDDKDAADDTADEADDGDGDQITVPERDLSMDSISDTDLAGTPLSGTGVIDADQIESMLDMDGEYETDADADAE